MGPLGNQALAITLSQVSCHTKKGPDSILTTLCSARELLTARLRQNQRRQYRRRLPHGKRAVNWPVERNFGTISSISFENMYAPIALFAYNRPVYLAQTLSALQRNALAEESQLIVYCDGPKLNASDDDRIRIQQVRALVNRSSGFKSVQLNTSDHNRGLAKSIVEGVTAVVNEFGSVIVLEDDIITSPFFLTYMNEGLRKYIDNDRVISIHGYCYPAEFPASVPPSFFIKGADCWGWGTWQRGWDLFRSDANELIVKIERYNLQKEFNFGNSFDILSMLRLTAVKNHSWAVKWYASAFIGNKLTLYPKKSLVINIGAVGTNMNFHQDDMMRQFGKEFSDAPLLYFEEAAEENQLARKCIERYFKSVNRGPAYEISPSAFVRRIWRVLKR